jgi:hypothetical protein
VFNEVKRRPLYLIAEDSGSLVPAAMPFAPAERRD